MVIDIINIVIRDGNSLAILLLKKFRNEKTPQSISLFIIPAIKNPEITKKTSTPRYPWGILCSKKW